MDRKGTVEKVVIAASVDIQADIKELANDTADAALANLARWGITVDALRGKKYELTPKQQTDLKAKIFQVIYFTLRDSTIDISDYSANAPTKNLTIPQVEMVGADLGEFLQEGYFEPTAWRRVTKR